MVPKPLEEISLADLQALLEAKVTEGRTLEYKREVGTNDDAKKEFLADVSSFANTSGGDLILGLMEESGIPTALPGLPTEAVDQDRVEPTELHFFGPRAAFDPDDQAMKGGIIAVLSRIAA